MAAQPTEPAPFAAAYIVDGVNICGASTARCDPCRYGSCPGGLHSWAGLEDVVHALRHGQPDPATQRCGCPCTDGPELQQEPDPGDIHEIPFSDLQDCPVCGENGPCGYDAEGRPMVHTDAFDEDD